MIIVILGTKFCSNVIHNVRFTDRDWPRIYIVWYMLAMFRIRLTVVASTYPSRDEVFTSEYSGQLKFRVWSSILNIKHFWFRWHSWSTDCILYQDSVCILFLERTIWERLSLFIALWIEDSFKEIFGQAAVKMFWRNKIQKK